MAVALFPSPGVPRGEPTGLQTRPSLPHTDPQWDALPCTREGRGFKSPSKPRVGKGESKGNSQKPWGGGGQWKSAWPLCKSRQLLRMLPIRAPHGPALPLPEMHPKRRKMDVREHPEQLRASHPKPETTHTSVCPWWMVHGWSPIDTRKKEGKNNASLRRTTNGTPKTPH